MGKLIKIDCVDNETRDAMFNALGSLESQIVDFSDRYLRSTGYGPTDTTLQFNKEAFTLSVSPNPVDKGVVLSLIDGSIASVEYVDLQNGDFYVDLKNNKLGVYKKEEGVDSPIALVSSLKSLVADLEKLPEQYAKFLEQQELQQKQSELKQQEPQQKQIAEGFDDADVITDPAD